MIFDDNNSIHPRLCPNDIMYLQSWWVATNTNTELVKLITESFQNADKWVMFFAYFYQLKFYLY